MEQALKDSQIILHRITNQMINTAKGLNYIIEVKKSALRNNDTTNIFNIDTALYSIINYQFIWYSAFWDEFNKFFKSNNEPNKTLINEIKQEANVSFTDIESKFGNIKDARNKILAHGYRHQNNTILTNEEANMYFDIIANQSDIRDYFLLSKAIEHVMLKIEEKFGKLGEDDIFF